jgi:hypothetical protein
MRGFGHVILIRSQANVDLDGYAGKPGQSDPQAASRNDATSKNATIRQDANIRAGDCAMRHAAC